MAAPEDIVAAIKKHLQTAQAADGAHLDVRKRCRDAGLNLDEVTFKNADVTTWDDSEVVVGPNGEPTFLAKTMVDSRIKVNSVNGDKLIPREMALFSPGCMKMRNRCFVLPAKLIVVGKFADGTPITYGSRAHKMMILLDLFRQYLHQHGRTLAQATAEDKKLLKLWREKLMAQDVSSTQAAVYVKFLISNDMPEEEIVYYIEQHAYSALIRTCCMHIGGNQIVFTTDPERDKTLGPVDYQNGVINYIARQVTSTTLKDAVAAESQPLEESPPKKQRVEKKTPDAPAMVQQGLPLVDPADPSKFLKCKTSLNGIFMINGELEQCSVKPVMSGGGMTRSIRSKGATRGGRVVSEEEEDDGEPEQCSVCVCNLMPSERVLAPLRQLSTEIRPGHYFRMPTSISVIFNVLVNQAGPLNSDIVAGMVGDIATLHQNLEADFQAAQGGAGGTSFGFRHEVTPFNAAAATAEDKATVKANLGSMPHITSEEIKSFEKLLDGE